MRLKLHNVGPIRDADVHFAPLTIFTGENSTGKTTLSTVAYAAARAQARAARFATRRVMTTRTLRESLDGALDDYLDTTVSNWESNFRDFFAAEVQRCLAPELALFGREFRAGKGAAPRITIGNAGPKGHGWQLVFRLENDRFVIERANPEYHRPTLKGLHDSIESTNITRLERQIRRELTLGFPSDSIYFPPARSGFMQTYQSLISLVIGALGGGYFEDVSFGSIPGTTADFLQFIARLKPELGPLADSPAVRTLLDDLLAGELLYEASSGQSTLSYKQSGSTLIVPIDRAATSAAEVAPVVLYLMHRANFNDAMFIDEPEAHFHPKSQVAMAKALFQLSHDLRNVVIATHSDHLVAELSNLILESELETESPASVLNHVAIYDFDKPTLKQGSTVSEIPISASEGFAVDRFSSVADKTFERSVSLFDELHREQ